MECGCCASAAPQQEVAVGAPGDSPFYADTAPAGTPPDPEPAADWCSESQVPEVEKQHKGGARGSSYTVRSSKTLNFVLKDRTLLRGCTLPQLLRGFGRHMDIKERNPPNLVESREVPRLSEFLSHSWRDSARSKLVGAYLYYNGLFAAMSAVAASLVAFVLTLAGVLPAWISEYQFELEGRTELVGFAPWSTIFGCPVFAVGLVLWHHLPAWLGGGQGKAVFFDRLCIDQLNPERKSAGIRSLSAFIAHCDRFLLCWSPHYFTRLWCTHEVATFLHIQGTEEGGLSNSSLRKALAFRPLQLSNLTLSMILVAQSWMVLLAFSRCMGHFYKLPPLIVDVVTQIIPSFVCECFLTHFMRIYARDRAILGTQLAEFQVQAAQCFSEDDRVIIYSTIQQWFGSLEQFNMQVRSSMRNFVLRSVPGKSRAPLNIIMYPLIPVFFYALDWTAAFLQFEDQSAGLAYALYIFNVILILAINIDLVCRTANRYCPLGKVHAVNIAGSIALSIPLEFCAQVLLFTAVLLRGIHPLAELAFGALMFLLVLALQGIVRVRCPLHGGQAEAAAQKPTMRRQWSL